MGGDPWADPEHAGGVAYPSGLENTLDPPEGAGGGGGGEEDVWAALLGPLPLWLGPGYAADSGWKKRDETSETQVVIV